MRGEGIAFMGGRLMKSGFTDSQTSRLRQEIGDVFQDLAGQYGVFGFFGIDGNPAEMTDPILCRPRRFELADLTKIIDKRLGVASVEASPKRGFRHGDHSGHRRPRVRDVRRIGRRPSEGLRRMFFSLASFASLSPTGSPCRRFHDFSRFGRSVVPNDCGRFGRAASPRVMPANPW